MRKKFARALRGWDRSRGMEAETMLTSHRYQSVVVGSGPDMITKQLEIKRMLLVARHEADHTSENNKEHYQYSWIT